MGKKRRKVSVNAIDKYLKQMKYRKEFKKPDEIKIRQPKVVVSRIELKQLQKIIDASKLEENKNVAFNVNVPVEKITRQRKVKKPFLAVEVSSPIFSDSSQVKKIKTTRPRNLLTITNQTKKKSNYAKKSRKKIELSAKIEEKSKPKSASRKVNKKKEVTVLSRDIRMVKKKFAKKLDQSSGIRKKVKRSLLKPLYGTDVDVRAENQTADVAENNNSSRVANLVTSSISFADLENSENVFLFGEKQTVLGNREDISVAEESSQPSLVSNEPCLCEPINFDVDEFAKPSPVPRERLIPNKYRPCVEELELLTVESITKFIKDNQQYYVDFRKPEPIRKITFSSRKKKRKEEFKDSFKCNPFDSTQQCAMYSALREIFNIPAGSFVECRDFFTSLIPEICCQLFAKIFQIKTSFAPRLIKKLYPNPVCPV